MESPEQKLLLPDSSCANAAIRCGRCSHGWRPARRFRDILCLAGNAVRSICGVVLAASPAQKPPRAGRHLAVPERPQCWAHAGSNLSPDVLKVASEQAATCSGPPAGLRQARTSHDAHPGMRCHATHASNNTPAAHLRCSHGRDVSGFSASIGSKGAHSSRSLAGEYEKKGSG